MPFFQKKLSLGVNSRRVLGVMLALTCLTGLPCGASVINGGFDSGLTGWTTVGDVQAGTAGTLGDDDVDYSALYQAIALAPGHYCLEFDFLNLLSSNVPTEETAFPDSFYASLYFVNDLPSFDLAGGSGFDASSALFDLESSGPSNVAGTITQSLLGEGWSHYRFNFANAYINVVPIFELLNFNTVYADSQVLVDNVSITECPVVPEPATITLSTLGLVGLALARKRRQTNS